MAPEEKLLHVFHTGEELAAAIDSGQISLDLDIEIAKAGGMPQYIMSRVISVIAESSLGDLEVMFGKVEQYRGSGAAQPIVVRRGENEVSRFSINIERAYPLMEVKHGVVFIDDVGIKEQLEKDLKHKKK